MSNQKIIAQMVGRNEEQRFLKEVLQRISTQVDEIVFTDDCSEDNTYSMASEFCHTYKTEEPTFCVHEGKLRSIAWKNLSNHANPGDWIIAIDCDEMLYQKDDISLIDIRNILFKSEKDVVNVRFYHMWNFKQYRVDKLWAPNNSSRIFRFIFNGTFLDKALACGSEPTYVSDWIRQRNYWVNSGLIMKHLGYIYDQDKIGKYERYIQLDGGKFHQINHINSIMDKNPVLINWGNFGI
jgi:glycosyltransferase involved in cell wall biosynthesis